MERQSLIKELSGPALQYMIDRTQDRWRPILWPNFFAWENTVSITYETIIGDSGNAAAASVVSYDSAAPLRTRKALRKLTGEIPSIRQKFRMTEKDLQEYYQLRNGINANANAVLDQVYKDVQSCIDAPHKRLDILALEALSTGEVVLNATTNPDGMVTEEAVDFGMPTANKKFATATWSTGGTTAKPITDIMAVVEAAQGNGHQLDVMYMRRSVFNYMRLCDEVADYVTGWRIGANQNTVNLSVSLINQFLQAEGLPRIVLIEAMIDVEKDGATSAYNPWDADNILFAPLGSMGAMKNAPIMERAFPAKHVNYAEANRVLIKKWSETDPLHEYTACELNAFPSWGNVDKCYLMDSEATS
jgi:hypothetical protein